MASCFPNWLAGPQGPLRGIYWTAESSSAKAEKPLEPESAGEVGKHTHSPSGAHGGIQGNGFQLGREVEALAILDLISDLSPIYGLGPILPLYILK